LKKEFEGMTLLKIARNKLFEDDEAYIRLGITSEKDTILEKMQKDVTYLDKNEMTNGIHPHFDFVDGKQSLKYHVPKGTGIFGLSDAEKESLHLTKTELSLVKPYYTTEQIHRYYSDPKNDLWLIYTGSDFKYPENIKPYPHIKNHLDKFQNIITSDNKPYGLHRARKESFFKGEKIIAKRMCPNEPSFSYSNFDCYVSATFYVIKTNRINMKYLLALLNSSLIKFWLRNKGKMHGESFQLDKEPLLGIPIKLTKDIKPFVILVDEIITAKKAEQETADKEKRLDGMVYGVYGLDEEDVKIIEGRE
jgi:adenine-specific DNA-methyltransferase